MNSYFFFLVAIAISITEISGAEAPSDSPVELRTSMLHLKQRQPELFNELTQLSVANAGVADFLRRPATQRDPEGQDSPKGDYIVDGVVTHLGTYGMQGAALRSALQLVGWDLASLKVQFPALAAECGPIAVVHSASISRRCFWQGTVEGLISTLPEQENDPVSMQLYGNGEDNGGPPAALILEPPTQFELKFDKDSNTYYLIGDHTYGRKRANGYSVTELHHIRVDPDRLRIERIETYAVPPNEKLGPAYLESTKTIEARPPPPTVDPKQHAPENPAPAPSPTQTTSGSMKAQPTRAPEAEPTSAANSDHPGSIPWFMWVAAISAAVGLLWWTLKKRK